MNELKVFTHSNLEGADSAEPTKGGPTVEEAIAAVKRLSPEERKQLLYILKSKYFDEVARILHRDGLE